MVWGGGFIFEFVEVPLLTMCFNVARRQFTVLAYYTSTDCPATAQSPWYLSHLHQYFRFALSGVPETTIFETVY